MQADLLLKTKFNEQKFADLVADLKQRGVDDDVIVEIAPVLIRACIDVSTVPLGEVC